MKKIERLEADARILGKASHGFTTCDRLTVIFHKDHVSPRFEYLHNGVRIERDRALELVPGDDNARRAPPAWSREVDRVKGEMTPNDHALARALFAAERYGDAMHPVTDVPPLYVLLAYSLRDRTNREIVRDLLEERVTGTPYTGSHQGEQT